MAADFTISQPGGAGSAPLNTDLENARVGVEIQFASLSPTGNLWALADKPDASSSSLGGTTSQVATLTVDGPGEFAVILTQGGASRMLVVEVNRDAAGDLIDYGLVAPARGRFTAGSVTGRGVARTMERFRNAVVTALSSSGGAVDFAGVAAALAATSSDLPIDGLTLAGPSGGALTGGKLVAFSSLLTFEDHERMVFSGDGVEACVLGIDAATTKAQGAIVSVFIPAGEAGSLVAAGDLNAADWDTFVPSSDYLVTACWTNSTVVSSGKNLGTRDATVPTLTSATIYSADPDALELVFDKPVYAPDIVGLSLTFNVGTARTISTVTSGQGTTTLTLALSGDVSLGDDIDLVVGGTRTVQDLNGNLLGTSTTAVTLSGFALPGAITGATHLWRGDAMTTTGADVDTVTDPIGSLTMLASPTNPTTSTMGTNSVPCWEFGSSSYLNVDPPTGEAMATGFFAMTVDWTGVSANPAAPINGGKDGSEAAWEIASLFSSPSTLTNYLDGVGVNISDATFPATGILTIVVTWTPTERQIYVNGALKNTQTSAVVVEDIGRWTLGMKCSLDNAWTAIGLKMYDVQVGTTHVDLAGAGAYHTWAQGEVGF